MSELDDVLDNAFASLGPQSQSGTPVAKPDIMGGITGTRNALTRSAAEMLGLPDAMRALRGEFTPEEAQHFAVTAALGALPGSKMENMLVRSAGKLADISERGITKALAKNPGASIMDIVGTHVGGPSTPYKYTSMNHPMSEIPGVDYKNIPREAYPATPLSARILGRSENLAHGTRVGLAQWESPEGGGDAFKLPEDELGVHFGNPKQSAVFAGDYLTEKGAPRTYPVIVAANNPLRMKDLGTWHEDKILGELSRLNKQGDTKGAFPVDEVNELYGIPAIRDYLHSKGYDSVVYKNKSEDPGHDSFIKFTPSPVAPEYVAGVRSPFAAFNPNKLSWPELAAGIGGVTAGSGLMFDKDNQPLVNTQ